MVEATDPINPVNPLFYSFGLFLAKIRKVQKPIKIPLIFPIFPFQGNREGPLLLHVPPMVLETKTVGEVMKG